MERGALNNLINITFPLFTAATLLRALGTQHPRFLPADRISFSHQACDCSATSKNHSVDSDERQRGELVAGSAFLIWRS